MSWHPADLFHRRQPRFKYFEPDVWKPYQTLSGKIWILLEKGFSAMFIEGLYIYIYSLRGTLPLTQVPWDQ